jgi:lambda family phage portal protein
MGWWQRVTRSLLGGAPLYDGTGFGRRTLAWQVANPGAVAALLTTQTELRAKSRDLVRRNTWAHAALESYVANAIGTGIKPQSLVTDAGLRETLQALWSDWTDVADAAGLTDFYGLQALACRAMLEGGETLVRLRYRRPEDGLPVALQLQVLEPEHLPVTLNTQAENGNVIRAGIEFDGLGRRVAHHLYRSHPEDGVFAPMSGAGGLQTVRVTDSFGRTLGFTWLVRDPASYGASTAPPVPLAVDQVGPVCVTAAAPP